MLVGFAIPSQVGQIFERVEKVSWAPWLAASSGVIEKRIQNFQEGQLVALEGDKIAGYLSLNRLNLDTSGDWPNWMGVVGKSEEYDNFNPNGNALFLVSMGIAPEFRGSGVVSLLLSKAKELSHDRGVLLASCFRPSGYGLYKFERKEIIPLSEYMNIKNADGYLVDPWLRSLSKNGAKFVGVSENYYSKDVSNSQLEFYKNNYNKDRWWNTNGTWECAEAGNFVENKSGGYTYLESNVCGLIG